MYGWAEDGLGAGSERGMAKVGPALVTLPMLYVAFDD